MRNGRAYDASRSRSEQALTLPVRRLARDTSKYDNRTGQYASAQADDGIDSNEDPKTAGDGDLGEHGEDVEAAEDGAGR
jgi:hypothetical protein